MTSHSLIHSTSHRVTPFSKQPSFNFERQLVGNQLWELISFAGKAGFFFLLTPVMVQAWGEKGYGLFAVAGSAFLFLGLLDFGVKPRLRIALSQSYSRQQEARFPIILRQAVMSQSSVTLPVLVLFLLTTASGFAQTYFNFSPPEIAAGRVTLIGAIAFLLSSLLLEPIIARGNLGQAKMVAALAALAAIPAAWLAVISHCTIATTLAAWFATLVSGNLAVFFLPSTRLRDYCLFNTTGDFVLRFPIGEGLYFNASTLSWLAKTHLLTLIVALLGGVTEAGLFYVCLRLSEIVSNFGAMSADAAISGLAHATNAGERRRRFAGVVSYAGFFSFQAALAVALLAPPLIRLWWPATPFLSPGMATLVALFGLSMGLNRVISCAAFGLGLARAVAGWGILDGLVGIMAGVCLYPRLGLAGILAGSCLGSFCLLPLISASLRGISRRSLLAVAGVAGELLPWLTMSLLFLLAGRLSGHLYLLLAAAGCNATLSLFWIARQSKPDFALESRKGTRHCCRMPSRD